MIKRLKLTYQLYNFFQRKRLLHNKAIYKKYGIRKKYYSSVSSADLPENGPADPSLDETAFNAALQADPFYPKLSPGNQQALLNWSKNGFVVLDKYFDEAMVDKINKEVEDLITSKKVSFRYGGNKIMFAIHVSPLLKSIGDDPTLNNILRMLMQRDAVLFQSINFIKGSQQKTHSDSIHMSSYPLGNLIAIWIALEDTDESNGALHYYNGSHRLPYFMNKEFGNEGTKWMLGKKTYYDYEDMIAQKIKDYGLEKTIFRAKKGDVFIWHANLLHGGEPHPDATKTRKSMVLHYYGDGAICYHEVTQRPALIRR